MSKQRKNPTQQDINDTLGFNLDAASSPLSLDQNIQVEDDPYQWRSSPDQGYREQQKTFDSEGILNAYGTMLRTMSPQDFAGVRERMNTAALGGWNATGSDNTERQVNDRVQAAEDFSDQMYGKGVGVDIQTGELFELGTSEFAGSLMGSWFGNHGLITQVPVEEGRKPGKGEGLFGQDADNFFTQPENQVFGTMFDANYDKRRFSFLIAGTDDKTGEPLAKRFIGTRAELEAAGLTAMNMYGLPKKEDGVGMSFLNSLNNNISSMVSIPTGLMDMGLNMMMAGQMMGTFDSKDTEFGKRHRRLLQYVKENAIPASEASAETFNGEWWASGTGSVVGSLIQYMAVGGAAGRMIKGVEVARGAMGAAEIAPSILNTLTRYSASGAMSGALAYNDALNNGLSSQAATTYGAVVGGVMSVIESSGFFGGDVINKMLVGDETRQITRSLMHELSGELGEKTAKDATLALGKRLSGVAGQFVQKNGTPKTSLNLSKIMLEEGLEEGLQSLTEQAGQVFYNLITDAEKTKPGAGRFDVDGLTLKGAIKQALTESLFGAIGGGIMGPFARNSQTINQYVAEGKVNELKTGLDMLVADGQLSVEQRQRAVDYIDNVAKIIGDNQQAFKGITGSKHEKQLREELSNLVGAQFQYNLKVDKAAAERDKLMSENAAKGGQDAATLNRIAAADKALKAHEAVLADIQTKINEYADPDFIKARNGNIDKTLKTPGQQERFQNEESVALYQPASSDINAILTRESDGQKQAAFRYVDEVLVGLENFTREEAQAKSRAEAAAKGEQPTESATPPLPGLKQKLAQDLKATKAYLHPKVNTEANREALLALGIDEALLPLTTEQKKKAEETLDAIKTTRELHKQAMDELKGVVFPAGADPNAIPAAVENVATKYGLDPAMLMQTLGYTNLPEFDKDSAIEELLGASMLSDEETAYLASDAQIDQMFSEAMQELESTLAADPAQQSAYNNASPSYKRYTALRYMVDEKRFQKTNPDIIPVFQAFWHTNNNLHEITDNLTPDQQNAINEMMIAAQKPVTFRVYDDDTVEADDIRGFFNPRSNVAGMITNIERMKTDPEYRDVVFARTMHELRHAVTDEYINQLWMHWNNHKKGGFNTPQAQQFQRLFDLALLTQAALQGHKDASKMYFTGTVRNQFLGMALAENQGKDFVKDNAGNEVAIERGAAASLVKELFSEAESDEAFIKLLDGFNMNSKANRTLVARMYGYPPVKTSGRFTLLEEVWNRVNDVFGALRNMLSPTTRTLYSESQQLMASLSVSKFSVPLAVAPTTTAAPGDVSKYLNSITEIDFGSHFNPMEMLVGDLDLGDLALSILNKYQTTTGPNGERNPKLLEVANQLDAGNPRSKYEQFIANVNKIINHTIAPDFQQGSLKVIYFSTTDQVLLTWKGADGSSKRQFIRHTGEPVFVNSNAFNTNSLNTMSKPTIGNTYGGNPANAENQVKRQLLYNLELAQEEGFTGKMFLEYDPDHAWDNAGVTLYGEVSVMYTSKNGTVFPIGYMPDLTKPRLAKLLETGSEISVEVANAALIADPNVNTGSRAYVKKKDGKVIEYVDFTYAQKNNMADNLLNEGYVLQRNMAPSVQLRFTEVTNATEGEMMRMIPRDSFSFDSKNMEPGADPTDYLTGQEITIANITTTESENYAASFSLYNPDPFENPKVGEKLAYMDERLRRVIRRSIVMMENVDTNDVRMKANSLFNVASDNMLKLFPEDAEQVKYFGLGHDGFIAYKNLMVETEMKRMSAIKYVQKGGGWQGEGVNPATNISAKIRYDLESIVFKYQGRNEMLNYNEAKNIMLEVTAATDGFDVMLENLAKYNANKQNAERNRIIAAAILKHFTDPRPADEAVLFEKAKKSYWSQFGSLIRFDAATVQIVNGGARIIMNGQGQQERSGVQDIVRNIWENVRKIRENYARDKAAAEAKGETFGKTIEQYFNEMTGRVEYADPKRTAKGEFRTGINVISGLKKDLALDPGLLGSMGMDRSTLTDAKYEEYVGIISNYLKLLGIDLPTSVLSRHRLDKNGSLEAIEKELAVLWQREKEKIDEQFLEYRMNRDKASRSVLEPGRLATKAGISLEDGADYMILENATRFIGSGEVAAALGDGAEELGRLTLSPQMRNKIFSRANPQTRFSATETTHASTYKGDGVYTLPGGQKVKVTLRSPAAKEPGSPYMIDDFTPEGLEREAKRMGYDSAADLMSDTRPDVKRWTTGKIAKYIYDVTPTIANTGVYNTADAVAVLGDNQASAAQYFNKKEVRAAMKAEARILTRPATLREDGHHPADKALAEMLSEVDKKTGLPKYVESIAGVWESQEVVTAREKAQLDVDEAQWIALRKMELENIVADRREELEAADPQRYQYQYLEFERKPFKQHKNKLGETTLVEDKHVYGYRPYMEFYAQMIDLLHMDVIAALNGRLTRSVGNTDQELFSLKELDVAVKQDMKDRGTYLTPPVYFDANHKKHWAFQNKSFGDLLFERFANDPSEVRRYQAAPMYRNNIILDQFADRGRHLRPILVSGISHPEDQTRNVNYAHAKGLDYTYMNLAFFAGASQKEDGGTYYYHLADVPSDKPRQKAYPLRRIPRTEFMAQLKRIQNIEETRQLLAHEAFVKAFKQDAVYDENGKEVSTIRLDNNGDIVTNKHGMPIRDYEWSDKYFVIKDQDAYNQLAENRDFVRAKDANNEPMVNPQGQPVYQRGSVFNTDDHLFHFDFKDGELTSVNTADQVLEDFNGQFADAYQEYVEKGGVIPVPKNVMDREPVAYTAKLQRNLEALYREEEALVDLVNENQTVKWLKDLERKLANKQEEIAALEKTLEKLANNTTKSNTDFGIEMDRAKRETFYDMMMNHAINRYHLSMLMMGDYAFYKGGDEFTDMSKRSTDAPAQRMDWGKDHWAKMVAIRDIDGGETEVKVPRIILNPTTGKYEVAATTQDGVTNIADAQGYITEHFDERLRAAAGYFSEIGAPYKPVLFGHNPDSLARAMPLYLKLSFTIMPDYRTEAGKEFFEQYPDLKSFSEKLYESGADFGLFGSGIKVGQRAMNNYADEVYETQRIDLRSFGIQNNPKHLVDESGDIARGVQLERQLGDAGNFLHNQANGMFEYYQIMNAILETNSQQYFKEVLGTPEQVYQRLRDDLMKRDHTKDSAMALDRNVRLDNPAYAKLFESLVTSGLYQNTAGLRLQGQKLINQSDLGYKRPRYRAITLTADEGDYKAGETVYTVVDGELMDLQWMGPRKIEDLTVTQLQDLQKRIAAGKKVFRNDDPSDFILDYKGDIKIYPADMLVPKSPVYTMGQSLIASRIPGSGKNSIVAGEVAGFLPEGHGNVVVVSKEGPRIMGFDFDVDGFFVRHKNADPKFAAVNRMFDIAYGIMLNPANFMEITTPVNPELLGQLADELDEMKLRREESGDKPKRKYSKFTLMRQIELKELNSIGKDMISAIASAYGIHSVFSQMNVRLNPSFHPGNPESGLPPFLFDDRSYLTYSDSRTEILNPEDETELINFSNGTKKVRHYETEATDRFGQKWQIFDFFMRLLNGATDNAKHQFLGRLGLNRTTTPVVLDMIGHGIDLEYAIKFINQPIIQEFVDATYRQSGASTQESMGEVYVRIRDKYEKMARAIDANYQFDPLDNEGQSMRDDIINRKLKWGTKGMQISKQDRVYIPIAKLDAALEPASAFGNTPSAKLKAIDTQLLLLEKFDYYSSLARITNNGGKLVGLDSGFPATFLEMNDTYNRINEVMGRFELGEWRGQQLTLQNVAIQRWQDGGTGIHHPYYAAQYDRLGNILKWFAQYNLYAKQSINALHNRLVGTAPIDLQEKVMKGFYAYIFSANPQFSPAVLTGDRHTPPYHFVHEAANLVAQLQTELHDNAFIRILNVKRNHATQQQLNDQLGRPDEITFNHPNVDDPEFRALLGADFNRLPENYEYEGRQINVKDVLLANLAMTKGFGYSRFSYASILPPEVLQSTDQYLNDFEKLYDQAEKTTATTRQNAFLTSAEKAALLDLESETNPYAELWDEKGRLIYKLRENAGFIKYLTSEYKFSEERIADLLEMESKLDQVRHLGDFERQAYMNNPQLIPLMRDRQKAEIASKFHTYPGFSKVDFNQRMGLRTVNPKTLNWDVPMNFEDKSGNQFKSIRHAYLTYFGGKFNEEAFRKGAGNKGTALPTPLDIPLLTKMVTAALKHPSNRVKAAYLLGTGMNDLAYKSGESGLPTFVLEEVRSRLANEPWFKNGWENDRKDYAGNMKLNRTVEGRVVSIEVAYNKKSPGVQALFKTIIKTGGVVRMNTRNEVTGKLEPVIYEATGIEDQHFSGTYGLTKVMTLTRLEVKNHPGMMNYKRNFLQPTEALKAFAELQAGDPSFSIEVPVQDSGFEQSSPQQSNMDLLSEPDDTVTDRDFDTEIMEGFYNEGPDALMREPVGLETLSLQVGHAISDLFNSEQQALAAIALPGATPFKSVKELFKAFTKGKTRENVLEAARQMEHIKAKVPEFAFSLASIAPAPILWRSAKVKREAFKAATVQRIADLTGFRVKTATTSGYEVLVNGARVGFALVDGDNVYELSVTRNYEGSGLATKLLNEMRKTMPDVQLRFDNLKDGKMLSIGRKLGIADTGVRSVRLLSYNQAVKSQKLAEGELDGDSEYSPEIIPAFPREAGWQGKSQDRLEAEQMADGDMNKCLN